jgi:hypothetical protein
MPARSFPLEPAPIRVSDEVLDDLRRRLTATDSGTMDELVRQRGRSRKRVHHGRSAHPRDDLLAGSAIDTSIRTCANNNR